eukprot:TRINITY_DN203_c0_g1_i6.p1 TRINITY_DN203_c0_g1~~TRINITY_DN203_c0_g1_i6.p1  ORF type:complete len:147 (+),score=6.60 TRINITY_DN203_c0_g1_i6:191-631(+)
MGYPVLLLLPDCIQVNKGRLYPAKYQCDGEYIAARCCDILQSCIWYFFLCKIDANELNHWVQQVKKYIKRQDNSYEIQDEINKLNVKMEKMRANHTAELNKERSELKKFSEEASGLKREQDFIEPTLARLQAVSYTHLTLPTICSV